MSVVAGPSPIHGTGVFALRAFAPGETVLVIDDSRVLNAAHPLRPELGEFDYHCDYLAAGKVVLMPSPERHINSSCDPNTYVKTRAGLRHVVALRPIAAGEEITYDYIINCHGGAVWGCRCGAARCRGTIVSSFFDLPLDLQREYLRLLDDWFVEEHAERVAALNPGKLSKTDVMPPLTWDILPLPWQAALEEAWQAYRAGSLPIGAVVTDTHGAIIGRGRNRIAERGFTPGAAGHGVIANHELAHAEINALLSLRYVYENEGEDDDPHQWVLYTTMEPCPACMGAFYMSGLRELHYAARDPYAGSVNLLGATPYLSRKPIRVAGPDPALETISTALSVEWSMWKETKDSSQFVRDQTRVVLPAGVALGERLFERGVLRELRARGASAAEMVAIIEAVVAGRDAAGPR